MVKTDRSLYLGPQIEQKHLSCILACKVATFLKCPRFRDPDNIQTIILRCSLYFAYPRKKLCQCVEQMSMSLCVYEFLEVELCMSIVWANSTSWLQVIIMSINDRRASHISWIMIWRIHYDFFFEGRCKLLPMRGKAHLHSRLLGYSKRNRVKTKQDRVGQWLG